MSFHCRSLAHLDHFKPPQKNTPPSSTYNSVHMFEHFWNPKFTSKNCPQLIGQTKLNLHIFKSIWWRTAQSDVSKDMWFPILKGLKHPNTVLLKINFFLKLCLSGTTFVGYATNGHLVSLWDLKKKGLSVNTVSLYAQDRVGRGDSFVHYYSSDKDTLYYR